MDNQKIEERLNKIEKRNRQVELDKAWETSVSRKLAIVIITYIIMVLIFSKLNSTNPFLDAIIPTTGFFLSTLSLSFLKKIWIKYKK